MAAAPEFPAARMARIRAAGKRLSVAEFRPDNLRHAAVLLERQAAIDLDVPLPSRIPGVALVKLVLKRLMVWYLRFIANQISAFGQATARFGVVVATRVDRLDADVADLQERVARLEAAAASAGERPEQ